MTRLLTLTTGLVLAVYVLPALYATQLANAQCARQFGHRPFSASMQTLSFHGGRYVWGTFDPAGIDGYSASVSFTLFGFAPEVRVYRSSDEFR